MPPRTRSQACRDSRGRFMSCPITLESYDMNRPLPANVILSNNGRVPYDRKALRTYLETNDRWPHDRQQVSNAILSDLGVTRHARTFADVNWGQYNTVAVPGNSSNNNNSNVRANANHSALVQAVRSNDLSRVRRLLERGANVNAATNNDGWTPLHWAVDWGRRDVVALLLRSGANVDAVDNYGWTPLHVAASDAPRDIVALLLRSGANVNAATNNGRTPLHVAVVEGRRDIVALLLQSGVNVSIRNQSGRTARNFANRNSILALFNTPR
jgi:hypothetical protein